MLNDFNNGFFKKLTIGNIKLVEVLISQQCDRQSVDKQLSAGKNLLIVANKLHCVEKRHFFN